MSGPWEQYQTVPAAPPSGPWEQYQPQEATSEPWKALPRAQTEALPPEQGFLSRTGEAIGAGLTGAARDVAALPAAVRGQTEKPAEATKDYQQPLKLSDLLDPGQAIPKVAYQLAQSWPTLAGGVAGGAAGAAAAGPVGGVVGGAAGAAVTTAMQQLAPLFSEEMQKPGANPDHAFNTALERAGQSGLFSAIGWGAFAWSPFVAPVKTLLFQAFGVQPGVVTVEQATVAPVKNLLFQAFGVQPGVAAVEQATSNVEQGRPVTEGMEGALLGATVGTAVPMAGREAVRRLTGASVAATPPADTAAASNPTVDAVHAAEAQLAAGHQTPEQAAEAEIAEPPAPVEENHENNSQRPFHGSVGEQAIANVRAGKPATEGLPEHTPPATVAPQEGENLSPSVLPPSPPPTPLDSKAPERPAAREATAAPPVPTEAPPPAAPKPSAAILPDIHPDDMARARAAIADLADPSLPATRHDAARGIIDQFRTLYGDEAVRQAVVAGPEPIQAGGVNASPAPGEPVTLYRGVPAGVNPRDVNRTAGRGLFYSPDEKVARAYAGKTGTVVSDQVSFNNLLDVPNWMEAKRRLGLPISTTMPDLLLAASKAGYDGVTFTTKNGREFIHFPEPPAPPAAAAPPEPVEKGAAAPPWRPAAILAELDARKAPDADYRQAFSTFSKTPLAKGETWRGRLVDYVAKGPDGKGAPEPPEVAPPIDKVAAYARAQAVADGWRALGDEQQAGVVERIIRKSKSGASVPLFDETLANMEARLREAQEKAKPAKPIRDRPVADLTDEEARQDYAALQGDLGADYGYAAPKRPAPGSDAAGKLYDRMNELRERLGYQPWQRTAAEMQSRHSMPAARHRQEVERAIAAGKPVPEHVLAEYRAAAPSPAPEPPRKWLVTVGKMGKKGVQRVGTFSVDGRSQAEADEAARVGVQKWPAGSGHRVMSVEEIAGAPGKGTPEPPRAAKPEPPAPQESAPPGLTDKEKATLTTLHQQLNAAQVDAKKAKTRTEKSTASEKIDVLKRKIASLQDRDVPPEITRAPKEPAPKYEGTPVQQGEQARAETVRRIREAAASSPELSQAAAAYADQEMPGHTYGTEETKRHPLSRLASAAFRAGVKDASLGFGEDAPSLEKLRKRAALSVKGEAYGDYPSQAADNIEAAYRDGVKWVRENPSVLADINADNSTTAPSTRHSRSAQKQLDQAAIRAGESRYDPVSEAVQEESPGRALIRKAFLVGASNHADGAVVKGATEESTATNKYGGVSEARKSVERAIAGRVAGGTEKSVDSLRGTIARAYEAGVEFARANPDAAKSLSVVTHTASGQQTSYRFTNADAAHETADRLARLPPRVFYQRPSDTFERARPRLTTEVDALLARVAPGARGQASADLQGAHGAYFQREAPEGVAHIIAWALTAPDALHTASHEAIHYLRRAGFLRPEEWATLERAAHEQGWGERTDARYPDLDPEARTEEAIAERYADWAAGRRAGTDTLVGRIFNRLTLLRAQLGALARRVLGRDATAEDIFGRVESGEVGRREAGEAIPGKAEQRALVGPVKEHIVAAATDAKDWLSRTKEGFAHALFPMLAGSKNAQTFAARFANGLRAAMFRFGQIDRALVKQFTPEQRAAMGRALDRQSVFEQQVRKLPEDQRDAARQAFEDGKTGLAALPPDQRAAVEALNRLAMAVWERMRAAGLVMPDAQGIPYYMARQFVKMARDGQRVTALNPQGRNLTTAGPKARKHETWEETEAAGKAKLGDEAELVSDIRSLVHALSRNERAITGRNLVEAIRRYAPDAVKEGGQPEAGYHTLDHPSMWRWTPDIKKGADGKWHEAVRPVVDQDGNPVLNEHGQPRTEPVFKRVPIHIHEDFKGPLNAVLSHETPEWYRSLMQIKSGVMHSIMFSPYIHLMVEMGRALPVAPGKVITGRILADGQRYIGAKPGTPEAEWLNKQIAIGGMSPIGQGWIMDPATIMEQAQAGERSRFPVVQAFKDWHQTALWDRVFKLQVGLARGMYEDAIAKGFPDDAAHVIAGHIANRYAGALPPENLSRAANMLANVALFSRSFTLGNLGVIKDMTNGAPSHTRALIEQMAGPETARDAQTMLRRKAVSAFTRDIALYLVGYGVLQSTVSVIRNMLDGEGPGDAMAHTARDYIEHVSYALTHGAPSGILPQMWNEPGKKGRMFLGEEEGGKGIYARLPPGKVGEEFLGWFTHPGTMAMDKLSPLVRPFLELMNNRDSMDRQIMRPNPQSLGDLLWCAGQAAGHILVSQLPIGAIQGAAGLVGQAVHPTMTGQQLAIEAAKLIGPATGVAQISGGHPQGPKAGFEAAEARTHEYDRNDVIPQARRMIQAGDTDGARALMERTGLAPHEVLGVVRSTLAPQRTQANRDRSFGRIAGDAGRERAGMTTGANP